MFPYASWIRASAALAVGWLVTEGLPTAGLEDNPGAKVPIIAIKETTRAYLRHSKCRERTPFAALNGERPRCSTCTALMNEQNCLRKRLL